MANGFDVAQICLNGHIINDAFKREPKNNQKFCEKCGAETITQCPYCQKEIRGQHFQQGFSMIPDDINYLYYAPAFCSNCGKPYPWTESKLQAVKELVEEFASSEEEKNIVVRSIDDLVKDSPQTTLASTRFKKFITNSGKQVAGAFRDILVDIASETAKKIIWPDA